MIKSVIMYNIKDMNKLPVLERWLYKDHAPEIISSQGPIMAQYDTYRCVYVPKGMSDDFNKLGTYNWRVINQWWHEKPFENKDNGKFKGSLGQRSIDRLEKILDIKEGKISSYKWFGNEKIHPPVYAFLPFRHTNDFKGAGINLFSQESLVRWVVAIKYPQGVSIEEGEDWYLNVHAPEVSKQKGLIRFFSSRVIEPKVGPFVRISEMWYTDLNSWKHNVIEDPPVYTKPNWASYTEFPFLKPFVDFVGIFLDERPECNFLTELGPYTFIS